MLKLNIKLSSIKLSSNIIDHGDTIRVSITTIPDEQKKAQIFDVADMDVAMPSFQIKMNDCIQKILIVFRKKSFFSDGPIIASTVIHRDDIGIFDGSEDEDYKKINIYETNRNKTKQKNRRVVGSMEVFFSLKEELQHVHYVVKHEDGKKFSSLRAFFNENENPNF